MVDYNSRVYLIHIYTIYLLILSTVTLWIQPYLGDARCGFKNVAQVLAERAVFLDGSKAKAEFDIHHETHSKRHFMEVNPLVNGG